MKNKYNMEFYRYEIRSFSVGNIDGNSLLTDFSTDVNVKLLKFCLVSETPKGYWICSGDGNELHSDRRWISKTSRKRYAYPTKKEAMVNLIKRSESRSRILRSQLHICNRGLEIVKKMYDGMDY